MAANPTPDLRDIHLPDPLSIWPLAFGWYVLAALILITLIPCVIVIIRRRRFTRARRAALAELTQAQALSQLSTLLRRTALAYYKHANIEAISGEAWITFLKATHKKPLFNDEEARLLTEGCYQKNVTATPELTEKCRRWIKSCGDVQYV